MTTKNIMLMAMKIMRPTGTRTRGGPLDVPQPWKHYGVEEGERADAYRPLTGVVLAFCVGGGVVLPDVEPIIPTLAQPFHRSGWVYEEKYDGLAHAGLQRRIQSSPRQSERSRSHALFLRHRCCGRQAARLDADSRRRGCPVR